MPQRADAHHPVPVCVLCVQTQSSVLHAAPTAAASAPTAPPMNEATMRVFELIARDDYQGLKQHVEQHKLYIKSLHHQQPRKRRIMHDNITIQLEAAQPPGGATPLHMAVGVGNALMVEYLLSLGHSPHVLTTNHATPLHWAMLVPQSHLAHDTTATEGILRIIKMLLDSGVNIRQRTMTWQSNVFGKDSGQTAVHWALHAYTNHLNSAACTAGNSVAEEEKQGALVTQQREEDRNVYARILQLLYEYDPLLLHLCDERHQFPIDILTSSSAAAGSQAVKDVVPLALQGMLQKHADDDYVCIEFRLQQQQQVSRTNLS